VTARAQVATTPIAETRADTTRSVDLPAPHTAWDLSDSEWREYQTVMLEQRGIWSPKLDPVTVLGVSTDSPEARRRYAELHVRQQFQRVHRELAFQRAVDAAWERLYPHTPRVYSQRANVADTTPLRYALVVSPDCEACDDTLNNDLDALQSRAVHGVDIHVVGLAGDDAALRRWINDYAQLRSAVTAGQVTVNHGDAFDDLTVFPAVFAKDAYGQWSRER